MSEGAPAASAPAKSEPASTGTAEDPAAAEPSKPQPKLDPESLALRTRPIRAIRIKRSAVIALSALGLLFVAVTGWLALRHPGAAHPANASDQSQPASNPASDSLNGLPKNYGEVPRLGPPLPGDFGKPMLDQQNGADGRLSPEAERAAQQADMVRQRQLAQAKAADESGLMVHGADQPVVPAASPASTTSAKDRAAVALDPEKDPNGQGHKADFVVTLAKDGTSNPHGLEAAPSPYLLSAGSIISASLITGLRSDLPGMVTAQVTDNVFDSPTGRILLVPQGARLIGKYDSVVAFGQKRALVVWQRILFPDGRSISLDNMPATDPAGYAGLQDKVDFHTWQLLKGVAISTLLGIGADLQFSGNGGLVDAIRQSATQNVSRAGDQLTARTLDIQPTLTIRPGAPVRLVVDRDLVLTPWKETGL